MRICTGIRTEDSGMSGLCWPPGVRGGAGARHWSQPVTAKPRKKAAATPDTNRLVEMRIARFPHDTNISGHTGYPCRIMCQNTLAVDAFSREPTVTARNLKQPDTSRFTHATAFRVPTKKLRTTRCAELDHPRLTGASRMPTFSITTVGSGARRGLCQNRVLARQADSPTGIRP